MKQIVLSMITNFRSHWHKNVVNHKKKADLKYFISIKEPSFLRGSFKSILSIGFLWPYVPDSTILIFKWFYCFLMAQSISQISDKSWMKFSCQQTDTLHLFYVCKLLNKDNGGGFCPCEISLNDWFLPAQHNLWNHFQSCTLLSATLLWVVLWVL